MALVSGCGRCKTPLESPAEPKPDSVRRCPSCGESDTLENVRRIIGEFVQEQATDALGAMLRDVTSRSGALTLSEIPRPKRVYRFVPLTHGR